MIPPLLFQELTLLEPHRLDLAHRLAAADGGALAFMELRRHSGLTDGNLNRHLHRLAADGIVESVRVKQPGRHPRTVVQLTANGRARLRALAVALRKTAAELETGQPGMRVVRVPRGVDAEPQNDVTLVAPTPAMEFTRSADSLVDEAFVGPD